MNIATPLKFTDKKAIEASLSRHLWPILGNFIAFPSQLPGRPQCTGCSVTGQNIYFAARKY